MQQQMPIHHPFALRIPNLELSVHRHEIPTLRHTQKYSIAQAHPNHEIGIQHSL